MAAVARLGAGENLLLLAPFEPAPLFSVLAKQGFRHVSQRTASGDWQVILSRDLQPLSTPRSHRQEEALTDGEIAGVKENRSFLTAAATETLNLDARGLEPPQPLVTILEALGTLPAQAELSAHTDRRPMHLYAQLEARGFTGESQEQSDGSFITHIRHR
jgi:uncharacterized protein (DUF2249 family)